MTKKQASAKNNLVVMKFGGTSVATPERIKKVANHIKKRKENGENIIVVVSAMGKETDRLVSLINEITPNPNLREYDQILQTGEIISAGLLAIALEEIGIPAISLSAMQVGIESNREHGNAKIKRIRKKDYLQKTARKQVVIIPGFQGVIEGSLEISTLGRGGSDASAVAIAAAIKADICEIYTDVDGVYTIDPRLVPNATRFEEISFMQMIAMAAAGAGVLMDRSVEIAQAHNISIKVLLSPSFGNSTGGTIV
ncbi:MAG: aspartate kinase, partial [Candidatus Magasanikbacteria bacterium]|nr:aspartate kinase [Candidatus Magasanikbacteria bacterium]